MLTNGSRQLSALDERALMAAAFRHFAAQLYGETVLVEFVDAEQEHSNAAVTWDASCGAWRVLVRSDRSGVGLMRSLCHELGHIRHGNCGRGATAESVAGIRDRLRGIDSAAAASAAERQRVARESESAQLWETAADAFAAALVAVAWPVYQEELNRIRREDETK